MVDVLNVMVGGVAFRGAPTLAWGAEYGLFLGKDGISGWFGGVSAKSGSVPREDKHGNFSLPTFKEGRMLTLSGYAWARSFMEMQSLADRVSGLGCDGQELRVVVSAGGETRWVDGRVISADFEWGKGSVLQAKFQVIIRCDDPRKYGNLATFTSTGSSVQSFHRGNAIASPVFEVTGFTSGWRLVGPGGVSYTVQGPKAHETVDRLDFSDGSLTRGGTRLAGAVTSARTWGVPPGQNVSWRIEGIGGVGSGTAVMYLPDTWL